MKNLSLFISQKIITKQATSGAVVGNKSTQAISAIATAGIGLGFVMILLSFSILQGFKHEIESKLMGFSGQMIVSNYAPTNALETRTVSIDTATIAQLKQLPNVTQVNAVANMPCIIKTNTDIEGALLKGVDANYDFSFFNKYLLQGRVPHIRKDSTCNEIIISQQLALKLKLQLNKNVFLYFVQNPPRMRKLKLVGIYQTGLEEFDKLFVIADLRHVQHLNNWKNNEVSSYEIMTSSYNETTVKATQATVNRLLPFDASSVSVYDKYPQIINWLRLQDVNVQVILLLVILISAINMIAALLITILENTTTIGILKSLGASNTLVRKVFLWFAFKLVGKGLLIGNIVGVGLCLLQQHFHIIPLDQASYYMSYVPIQLSVWVWLGLNVGTIIISLIILLIPAMVITSISPLRALRFQ
ncbi:MAG: FtsX-like permease family protein [Bacteroidia bacterium]|jgi:lipoprotein-releasing system permease protein